MILTIKPSEYDVSIGVDVDQKSYAMTYICAESLQGRSFKMPARPDNLHHYFQKRFPGKRLVYTYEAGPTGYGLHDYLVSQGQNCMMVHPGCLSKSAHDFVKNNRLDSQKLAQQAISGQLKGIRVPSPAYRELRHLVTLRQQYAQDQRVAKQRIRSLLLFESIPLPDSPKPWTTCYRQALQQVSLQETLRFKLDLLLNDMDHARQRLLLIHRQIRKFCLDQESIGKNLTLLRTIPGIGIVVSTYLLARIGDPSYLQNIRELGSFSGLVPREHSTGDSIHKGSITHMGDSTLRSLLVQSAWITITKDKELGEFFHRLRAKRNAQIAIIATARKLTHRIYRVLKEQRPYVTH